jgi:hypothetical protein
MDRVCVWPDVRISLPTAGVAVQKMQRHAVRR